MDKRFFLFLVLASIALFANALIMSWLTPPVPDKPKPGQNQVAADSKPADKPNEDPGEKPADAAVEKPADTDPAAAKPDEIAAKPVEPKEPVVGDAQADPQRDLPSRWLTLGAIDPDPKGPYRMLVTLTTQGAAVERIELGGDRLNDLEIHSGYLGHLEADDAPESGAVVRVVGPGTPAAHAGLKVDDVITAVDDAPVASAADLGNALRKTRPGQQIKLAVSRGKADVELITATLTRYPLAVVRPEGTDPSSLLLTLEQLGKEQISKDLGLSTRDPESGKGAVVSEVRPDSPAADAGLRVDDTIVTVDEHPIADPAAYNELLASLPAGMRLTYIVKREGQEIKLPLRTPAEIAGLNMRNGNWQVKSVDEDSVAFSWELPGTGLEIVKRYRLAKATPEAGSRVYHLMLDVQIANRGDEPQTVAYQLDGPTGLPTEGWWFSNKIGRDGWIIPGPIGVRDVAVQFEDHAVAMISAQSLAGKDAQWSFPKQTPLKFIGIDAQYFAAVLIPQTSSENEDWFAKVQPLRVGPTPDDANRRKLVNTSCRVVSRPVLLAPGDEPLSHEFVVFAGPKRPAILDEYGLGDLVYFGWQIWGVFARLMTGLLHFFYDIVGNYGVAIIMLTVLVRGCMFPLSRKQAISAQKMQELQPEIKKIAEKYKSNLEQRNKAQQELFKKHNYNPLGGCLLMFVQLPIFLGLYRGLMIDVELRQAPLIPGWRWCSNLAAPDMLFRWDSWMPQFFSDETGWLGPYFNILPILTVGLFLWQQKLFMPPPADEQAALQQKMMKYMMVVMGLMFFKVASGLCIYFIASSLWGIAERKLLPKVTPQKKTDSPEVLQPVRAVVGVNGHGPGGGSRKKQRGGK